MATLRERVARARAEHRLSHVLVHAATNSKYLLVNPARDGVRPQSPGLVEPSRDDLPLVTRIFEAFVRMKRDQQTLGARYRPSPLWEAHLDDAFAPFGLALARDDVEPFHHFLANFGVWPRYTGIT